MQSIFNELKEGLSNGYGSRLATPDDHISKMFKKALMSIGADEGKHCNKDNSIRWNAYGEGQCKFCNKPWSLKDELDRQREESSLLSPPRSPLIRKAKQ